MTYQIRKTAETGQLLYWSKSSWWTMLSFEAKEYKTEGGAKNILKTKVNDPAAIVIESWQ